MLTNMNRPVLSTLLLLGLASSTPSLAASSKATGMINCKQARAQPYFPCAFVALREGPGAARVDITFPDSTLRTIIYKDGKVDSTNGPVAFTVDKIDDLATVHIGDESYEIVDAVPFGG
jgi:hypothetical protein